MSDKAQIHCYERPFKKIWASDIPSKLGLRRQCFASWSLRIEFAGFREVVLVIRDIEEALGKLNSWADRHVVRTPLSLKPGTSAIEPTPLGTVLIMAPWNYPVNLALVPFVGAIAGGAV